MERTISIITPFYKGNKYLGRLFASIEKAAELLDGSDNVELVLVNDSPDYESPIVPSHSSFACHVIEHDKNQGIQRARITGLESCSGDYIVFLDQDDIVDQRFLIEHLSTIAKSDVSVGSAYVEQSNGTLRPLLKSKKEWRDVLNYCAFIGHGNHIASPGQCLMRKESIPAEWCQQTLSNNGSDDYLLWLLLFKKGARFVACPNALYIHKNTGNNLSGSFKAIYDSDRELEEILRQSLLFSSDEINSFARFREANYMFHSGGILKKMRCLFSYPDIINDKVARKLSRILGGVA